MDRTTANTANHLSIEDATEKVTERATDEREVSPTNVNLKPSEESYAKSQHEDDSDGRLEAGSQLPQLPGNSYKQKMIWAVALLGVCAGFAVHLSTLIVRYHLYPVTTEMETKQGFEFPDVTLCSMKYYPKTFKRRKYPTRTENSTFTGEGVYGNTLTISRLLHTMFMENMSDTVPQLPFAQFYNSRLMAKQVAYRVKSFGDPYDYILFCEFNSEPCSYKNFTVYVDELHYKCMTFSPVKRALLKPGSNKGLFLLLYADSNHRLGVREDMTFVNGFEFVLHQPGVKPNFQESVTLAATSHKTSASVEAQVQKKVSRPSYRCVQSLPNVTYVTDYSQLDAKNISYTTFVGSENDCQVRLKQQQYLTECNCLATHLPLPADMFAASDGVCHQIDETLLLRKVLFNSTTEKYYFKDGDVIDLGDYFTNNPELYNATLQYLQCYNRVLEMQKSWEPDQSQCESLCNKTSYTVTPLPHPWPKNPDGFEKRYKSILSDLLLQIEADNITSLPLQHLQTDISGKVDKIAALDLYAKDIVVKESIEELAYPIENFFSDFGGILGLWMGASIITAMEMTSAVVSLVGLLYNKIKSRSSPKDPAGQTGAVELRAQKYLE